MFVEQLCKSPGQDSSGDGDFHHTRNWQPLVLVVPLRLGLNEINPVYVQGLKVRTTLTAIFFEWYIREKNCLLISVYCLLMFWNMTPCQLVNYTWGFAGET